jgi:hypothetical protein
VIVVGDDRSGTGSRPQGEALVIVRDPAIGPLKAISPLSPRAALVMQA